ncbi:MAG: T9SS type A sorting domain-containing protein [Saprospiraceae bacterium]
MVSPNGAERQANQDVGKPTYSGLGWAVFSPDGTQYARYNAFGNTGQPWTLKSVFEVYDFDRCAGLLSNHRQMVLDSGVAYPGGVAFSPNGRYLYVSKWQTVLQFDTQAPDLLASKTVVAEYDGFLDSYQTVQLPTRFYSMALAPDGRIYICVPNYPSRFLHVIEKPDLPGLACEVRQHAVQLPYYNSYSMPNMPSYRLGAWRDSPCDTLKTASGIAIPGVFRPEIRVFPNPNSGVFNVSTGLPTEQVEIEWSIRDLAGRQRANGHSARPFFEVSAQGLPAGVYVLALREKTGLWNVAEKFVVMQE